ncbi:hypothetical protein K435DRAFT_860320 [Dendrothele bispora CBS 962.96]|uniref:SH3 domain-containing protein n=1 Tax=Dendrothele bispora (strain CBS 962.96) TaxID=1314807 RepID=A0A4S8LYW5_DENBC|nr:hypothetical protein K435DRAFT_860320 [Dendrothele bispora CBS 962.96]
MNQDHIPINSRLTKTLLEKLNAFIAFKANARDSSDTMPTSPQALSLLPSYLPCACWPPSCELYPFHPTHPSHPAAPSIFSCLKEAQRGYADMRGTWTRCFLKSSGKHILDCTETGIAPIEIGEEFGSWTQSVFSIARDKHDLLVELSAIPGQAGPSYTLLLHSVLAMFGTTSTLLVTLVKRSLHKYGFVALTSVGGGREAERVGRGRKESNEFRDALQTIKSLCLRLFPEVLADVKLPPSMASANKFGDRNTGLADTTTNTVAFLNRNVEVFSASTDDPFSLGDGNQKMGKAIASKPIPVATPKPAATNESRAPPAPPRAAAAPPPPPPPPSPLAEPEVSMYKAKYAFQGEEGEMSLKKDELVEVIKKVNDGNGWWLIKKDGIEGWAPSNYLELVQPKAAPAAPPPPPQAPKHAPVAAAVKPKPVVPSAVTANANAKPVSVSPGMAPANGSAAPWKKTASTASTSADDSPGLSRPSSALGGRPVAAKPKPPAVMNFSCPCLLCLGVPITFHSYFYFFIISHHHLPFLISSASPSIITISFSLD